MDYETYARTFCEMQFMQAKRKMEEEQSISPRGRPVYCCVFSTAGERFWWGISQN